MNTTSWILPILTLLMKVRNPGVRVRPLQPIHKPEALELLSQEFCTREPLCRTLGLALGDIRPFFSQLLDQVIDQGLGVVAVGRQGQVLGVLTNEDHFDRMEPIGVLAEGLNTIGAYLDSISLPDAWVPSARGQTFHSGLAAVHAQEGNAAILMMMMLSATKTLKARGYTKGYAKVTNEAVVRRFQKLERLARRAVFRCLKQVKPSDFEWQGAKPFQSLKGSSYLYAWELP